MHLRCTTYARVVGFMGVVFAKLVTVLHSITCVSMLKCISMQYLIRIYYAAQELSKTSNGQNDAQQTFVTITLAI